MRTIKSIVEYRGTNYHGFQIQPDLRTVQGELEMALSKSLMEDIKIVGAGRTDAGVHALGQVISFETQTKVANEDIARLANYYLDKDIRLIDAQEVEAGFSARFSAKSKVYKYVIYNRRAPSAIYHDMTYHVHYDLDIDRMREAVKPIIG